MSQALLSKNTTVIIDDEKDDMELMVRCISKVDESKNDQIKKFTSGEEVLKFFKEDFIKKNMKIQFICLDLRMQKINGFQVLEFLKKENYLKKIPVMICTSSEDPLDIERSYELGANSYFVKPIEYGNFMERFRKAFEFWRIINRR